ncbi:MAG: hypothetical protein EOO02_16510, partial [Chitinophagaceae bacterium]
MSKSISKQRWDKLWNRMIAYGINDVPLKEMPLNIPGASKEPGEASARIMILLATAFCASNDS